MKLLHTSDWHVGKTLRGMPRLDEHRAVLDEITSIARDERVDVVLVTGDFFESAAPSADAQRVVFDTLLALRDTGARVIGIGGNHDHQPTLDAFAPLLTAAGVTVLGQATSPALGAVVELTTRANEPVVCALLPFCSQRFAIHTEQLLGLDENDRVGLYAQRMALIIEAICRPFRADAVNLLALHGFVHGGVLGGGEREAQTIFDYSIERGALPVAANYVALGHLHRCQRIEAPAPAWYAGSPIQVDFGEEADTKSVLLVETEPGLPARVEARRLTSGWTLRTVRGTLDELEAIAPDAGDAWLRVFVQEPARVGLADAVRTLLPRAVDVRIARSDTQTEPAERRASRTGRTPHQLFDDFLIYEEIADPRLNTLFAQLLDDVLQEVQA